MSNAYEAMLQLQKQIPMDETTVELVEPPPTTVRATTNQEMFALYQSIEGNLPDCSRKVIQFVSSRPGEGVSTIVREYAALAAGKLGKTVLLLDADQSGRDQQRFFCIKSNFGWDDTVHDHVEIDKALCRIGKSNLFVSPLSSKQEEVFNFLDPARFRSFFEDLKTRFDLVLLDSPPPSSSVDSIALSGCADGVVLVMEADKTRWPVVENAKKLIEKGGGNILGIVFNRRRYYIPKSIYRRL